MKGKKKHQDQVSVDHQKQRFILPSFWIYAGTSLFLEYVHWVVLCILFIWFLAMCGF